MDCSDKTRRTLGEALQTAKLSDEAMAFVNGAAGNSPAPKTIGGIIEPRTGPASKSNSVPHEPPVTASVSSIGTVSTTFRLPAELSAQLLTEWSFTFEFSFDRNTQQLCGKFGGQAKRGGHGADT